MMKKGWEIKKIGDVADIVHGKNQKDVVSAHGKYPIYGSGGTVMGYATEYLCPAGTTILGRKGTINNPQYINHKFWNVDTAFGIVAKDSIDSKYLFFFIKKQDWSKMNTGTTLPSLTQTIVKNVEIPLPPLSEQKEIVEHLDSSFAKIDTLKANAAKNLDEAKALFQSALKEALEPKKGWKEKTLKEVSLSITDGDHMPPPKANEGIPFITISNIDKETNTLNMEDTFYVPEDYYNSLKEDRKPQIGDLLYTVTGSFGIPVVVESDKRFCFQRHIAMIRPDKAQVLCKYLYYWCLSPNAKSEADKVATGTAQRTVSLTSLRKFIIPVPSIKEQEMLISYLYSLERKVNTLQQNYSRICSECDALKQAILKQVFE